MDIIPLVSANEMTTCGEVKLLSRVKDSLKLADLSIGRESSVTSLTKLKQNTLLSLENESAVIILLLSIPIDF